MSAKDLLGFYRLLGVPFDAKPAEIKSAYRIKAMDLHPDRNINRDTTADFQALQAAYEVLSNETSRQQYDADSSIPPSSNDEFETSYKPLDPICCSQCNAITAQPRYKVFYSVYGYIFGAYKKPHQGVFCSKCEIVTGLKASAITMIAGWWSVAGFFWSAQTLIQNLVGGRFYEQNARLQGYQAMYFAQNGNLELARAVAIQALKLEKKISHENKLSSSLKRKLGYENIDKLQSLRESLNNLIDSIPTEIKNIELKNTNDIFNMRFAFQSFFLIIFGTLISSAIYLNEEDNRKSERIRLEREGIESERAAAIAAQKEEELRKHELPLPASGIFNMANRRGFIQKNLPPLKITNSPDANTLLKLVRTSDGMEIMSIFIRAGQAVETGVPVGSYKIKIASGNTWYGESIRFGPSTSYATLDSEFSFSIEGSQLLGHELTLTRVVNGNLKQVTLNASDF